MIFLLYLIFYRINIFLNKEKIVLYSDGTNYQGYYKNSKYNGLDNINCNNVENIIDVFKEIKSDCDENLRLGNGI